MANTQTYSMPTRVLHWLTVLALVGTSILGFYFSDMPRGTEKSELIRLHASLGVLVLGLVLTRVGFRFAKKSPPPLEPKARVQNIAAHAVHGLLYIGLLVIVGGGMWTLFTVGWSVPFFGLFEIPTWYERDMALHHFYEEIHVTAWWVVTGLVALHVLAALFHKYVKKDATFSRMWFSRAK
jgi:cytochrome b561